MKLKIKSEKCRLQEDSHIVWAPMFFSCLTLHFKLLQSNLGGLMHIKKIPEADFFDTGRFWCVTINGKFKWALMYWARAHMSDLIAQSRKIKAEDSNELKIHTAP